MKKKLFLILFSFLIFSCNSDDNSEPEMLSLSESLVGKWNMTNYYDDSFFIQEQEGRIEKIVLEETNYGIEFTDNPKKINLSGFLRYSVDEYEINDGEKLITKSGGTNFMDAEHGEGYHTGEWKIEDGMLICSDVSSQEGIAYSTISSIELSGDNLKLTLDNSQFGSHLSGEIIIEYQKE